MRRWLMALSMFAFVAAISIAATAFQPAVAAGDTCATKHCSQNTHCCYGCTGRPICVRLGVPCPECAPQ